MTLLYLAPLVFFLIALIFSMLGMGGSQIYIPILFWLGMDFKTEAIPLGMLLNVVNSASAASTYARERLIDWKTAIPFAVCMVIFPPIGAWTNTSLPTRPVILIFALFTATAGLLMLSGWRPKGGQVGRKKRWVVGLTGGGILGFFAGLLGRGGGSFVVPLLYMVGLEPKVAAATSAMVVTFSGASSFLSHVVMAARPDWMIWIPCVASVFLGSQAGSRLMARKLKARSVKWVFGIVLLGVAAILILKDVL